MHFCPYRLSPLWGRAQISFTFASYQAQHSSRASEFNEYVLAVYLLMSVEFNRCIIFCVFKPQSFPL